MNLNRSNFFFFCHLLATALSSHVVYPRGKNSSNAIVSRTGPDTKLCKYYELLLCLPTPGIRETSEMQLWPFGFHRGIIGTVPGVPNRFKRVTFYQ